MSMEAAQRAAILRRRKAYREWKTYKGAPAGKQKTSASKTAMSTTYRPHGYPPSAPPPSPASEYGDERYRRIVEYERRITGRQEYPVVHPPVISAGSAHLLTNCVAPWDSRTLVDTILLKDVVATAGESRHYGNAVLIFEGLAPGHRVEPRGGGQPGGDEGAQGTHPREPLSPPPSVNSVVVPRPPTPRPAPDTTPLEPYPHHIPRPHLQGISSPYVIRIPAASISRLAEAAARRLDEMETERLRLAEEGRGRPGSRMPEEAAHHAVMENETPNDEAGRMSHGPQAPTISTLPELLSDRGTEDERDELAGPETPGELRDDVMDDPPLIVSRGSSTEPQPPDSPRETPLPPGSALPRYPLQPLS